MVNLYKSKIAKNIIFSFLLVFFTFVFAKEISADVYFPSECGINELFITKEIDSNQYNQVKVSRTGDGYCIDREEYCSKNKCGLEIKIRRVNSIWFQGKTIAVNFVINTFIILLFYLFEKTGFKALINSRSLVKIFIITIFGYLADFIAFSITLLLVTLKCRMGGGLCGDVWYKSSLGERVISPFFSITFPITVVFVFILITISFYKIYSNQISTDRRKGILYSTAFGILSNPIWYFLYQVVIR